MKIRGVAGTQPDEVAKEARTNKAPIMSDAKAQTDASLGCPGLSLTIQQ